MEGEMNRKKKLISSADIEMAKPKHGMALQFQPLSISFANINYFVDMPVVSSYKITQLSYLASGLNFDSIMRENY